VLALDEDRWLIVDHLAGKQVHHYSLHWLLGDFPYEQQEDSIFLSFDSTKYRIQMGLLEGNGEFSIVRGDENSARGWRSRYYRDKEPVLSVMLETDQPSACFWTYFGLKTDRIEIIEKMLEINSGDWNTRIDLQLNK
jgi:hypothetical protein